jgi:fused signal recognition particle receptor
VSLFNRSAGQTKNDPVARAAHLSTGLAATRRSLTQRLADLLLGKRAIDDAVLEELEAVLLGADIGVDTTQVLVADVTQRLARGQLASTSEVYALLRARVLEIVQPCSRPLVLSAECLPFVVMAVGVNGVGKTTTVGKLARRFARAGKEVIVAAADTFRAAAIEQLQTWGERAGVTVVAQHSGADAAAVAHDALRAARARGSDVLLVDTAGRQHTNVSLMDELRKIERVLKKIDSSAPHEVLLILDAVTGQNAISQFEHFHQAVGVTGLCMTKLDGTARGGILIALAQRARLPIRYVGVGEGIDDLIEFDAAAFVDALFNADIRSEV